MTATAQVPKGRRAAGGEGSLPALLLQRAAERPRAVALRKKELGRWHEYTWATYAQRAARIGLGLREIGVQRRDRVAVLSDNRPAWLFADLGIQGLGAVTVGVYPTSPEVEVRHVLTHSGATVAIVEDEEQLDKVLAVRGELPALRNVVVIDPRGITTTDAAVLTLAQLEERAAYRPVREWAEAVETLGPWDAAVVVYTSGTSGLPRGAILAHTNLMAAATISTRAFRTSARDEVFSYLPLAHVGERVISIVAALQSGYVVNFAASATETFLENLREVQPTFFLGVPRVWERLVAGVESRMATASRLKRANYRFWLKRGRRTAPRRLAGQRGGPLRRAADGLGWLLLFRSLRDKLGLGRVRLAVSAAAPIAPLVLEWFWAIGVRVYEGYGLTETTAQGTLNPVGRARLGSVGLPAEGVELKLAPDGEILLRTDAVFVGYYGDEQSTRDAVDDDGWLHTGDVGVVDDDGYLSITDRKKDIIITSGGKNVFPSEIEHRLKASPYIREAVVVGDRRPYLTALITVERDTVADWAAARQLTALSYADLVRSPEVVELVGTWVEQVNRDLARPETVKRFELLPRELDLDAGELTPTQKVRRARVLDAFADQVERMYASGPAPGDAT